MIPVRGYQGLRVGVLGLGRSGLSAARALSAGGAIPVGWDEEASAREAAAAEGIEISDLAREREAASLSRLIVSPGIPHLYPQPHRAVEAAWAASVPVDNDIGLFFSSLETEDWAELDREPKVVCITGSNGKSTTSALVHHIVSATGRECQSGGNIGRGALDLDPPGEAGVIVLELSSYQTELARDLRPDVAVFLNLSDDHLERHAGHGGYYRAKERLFTAGAPEHAVIGVDETEGKFLANRLTGVTRVTRILGDSKLTGEGSAVFARKGFLAEWNKGRQLSSLDLRQMATLPGSHNHQNACAAFAACRALGLAPKAIEAGLRSFPGLRHRCQLIAEKDGVRVFNDSKGTNADATAQALSSFENIRWIAGGQAKDGGIEPLRHLFGRIAKAYLIGEAEAAFEKTLGDIPNEQCGDLAAATQLALAEALPGDVVLLSPACASFDQFKSFEARGEAFEAMVASWKA